ncbi:mechanosensitive ion channel family protein [Azonexus hydrophilus]|uniref:Mechanosensitive ion channel family protein n=1 Tax=Azonexus hydrophilus TaxID=418702 RepID=A0ABZ2XGC6_9RHOO
MQQLDAWLSRLTGGDATLTLVVQVFLVVSVVVVGNFLLRRLLDRLAARTAQTANPWDEALVNAARRPLPLLAWIVGLAFAARIVQSEADAPVFEAVGPLRTIGVIGCLTWFLVRLIANMQAAIMQRQLERGEAVDRTTVDAIGKLLRVSVLITATLVGLQSLGFSISGVLAFGGIGGIAVGFAAKDLLANFFGGLMVYLDRPFAVGDWIRSPDKAIEGTVEDIGWRLTRIRTFDKRPLYVPNSIFTQIAVENPSRMSHRRIKEYIGVRYDDMGVVARIVDDIKVMLRAHPEIEQTQTMIVNLDTFGPSSVDILVYTFTRTTNWIAYHEIKQDVLLKIADIVSAHGAEIAFPTRTLHLLPGDESLSAPPQSVPAPASR